MILLYDPTIRLSFLHLRMLLSISISSRKTNWQHGRCRQWLLMICILMTVLCCFTSLITFGDSITDNSVPVKSPYGETYFHKPNGRLSDGRLIIDYVAQALDLPLLPHYQKNAPAPQFSQGVNFAISGATALNDDFLLSKGVKVVKPRVSLEYQLQWFKDYLASYCKNKSPTDCQDFIGKSLIFLGEIGGNDYNFAFWSLHKLEFVETYVQDVINLIGAVAEELISMGARTLVVPGNFPIGCNSGYLGHFQTNDTSQYDPKTGCLYWPNDLSKKHNDLLIQELDRVRSLHPQVTIIYGDYFGATYQFFTNPGKFGLDKPSEACCGGGGPYNAKGGCSSANQVLCPDPTKRVFFDSFHMTETAYGNIAQGILKGPFASPPIFGACSK